ncbi:hypothetical protein QU487_06650 [Crenobacter sp. SG2305]|uniref:hypothetical protein n=1 Tax=Crenobacter oryzisoli TaxID=3056844 RepID=UPI0025AA7DCD|nr:hypothetical protein [Crenobacter sp. SG2305]MDN0082433.1 hypothetical protein [Crenobacter sp. SG2305]
MSLNTVYAVAGTVALCVQLALINNLKAPSPPVRILHRAGARAGLVVAAGVLTWLAVPHAHVMAIAVLALTWACSALTGHTLLEDLKTYRDSIAAAPLPADFEG